MDAQLLNGLALGSTYALVAVGYTLVFGVLNVVNLAHGQVLILSAFVALEVSGRIALGGFVGALVVGGLAAAVVGVLVERIAIRPLPASERHGETVLITTIGVGIVIEQILVKTFGGRAVRFDVGFTERPLSVGGVTVSNVDVLVFLTAILLTVLTWLFIARTRTGRAIRATAEDAEAARLMGISTEAVRLGTFAFAAMLAGVAGVLIGTAVGAVSVGMATMLGLKGLVILIVAGSRSIPGAAVVAVALGVLEVFTVHFAGASYRDAIAFVVLMAALVLRPAGVFGSSVAVR